MVRRLFLNLFSEITNLILCLSIIIGFGTKLLLEAGFDTLELEGKSLEFNTSKLGYKIFNYNTLKMLTTLSMKDFSDYSSFIKLNFSTSEKGRLRFLANYVPEKLARLEKWKIILRRNR